MSQVLRYHVSLTYPSTNTFDNIYPTAQPRKQWKVLLCSQGRLSFVTVTNNHQILEAYNTLRFISHSYVHMVGRDSVSCLFTWGLRLT